MMGTEILVNYGVLGAWTLWLLYEKKSMLTDLRKAINELRDSIDRRNR